MASIDKIYCTTQQYYEFKEWCEKNYKQALQYMYIDDSVWGDKWNDNLDHPVSNFPEEIDSWMWQNCPIEWVRGRIAEQYDTDISILGTPLIQLFSHTE